MTPTQKILRLIDTPSPDAALCEEALDLCKRYPYFTVAAAAVARTCGQLIDPPTMRRVMSQAALGAPDRLSLFRLIDPTVASHATFYPPQQSAEVTTDTAIDTFLNNYGAPIDPEEQALLERLIFNPVPDYASVLASQAPEIPPEANDEQDKLMDAFLAERHTATEDSSPASSSEDASAIPGESPTDEAGLSENQAETTPTAPPPSSLLSESLAKIYIRRGKYDKAYEIIHNLNLNFPEKSIYFADQLRFLQKLILNSKYQQPKNNS